MNIKLKAPQMSHIAQSATNSYTAQNVYNDIHRLLMLAKISHYNTMSFAAHEAFGRTYDGINDLVDAITEKLIGYSGEDPEHFSFGTLIAMSPFELADEIIRVGKQVEDFADRNGYLDIENKAQEFSGVGATLKYLSRFS